jgi:ABC-type transport system substrate-binding protein
MFTGQIYEPPLQYHYLKRPYELEPLTATKIPDVAYFDRDGNQLVGEFDNEQVANSVYTITIKPNIYYQPHPAFVKDAAQQSWRYHHLSEQTLESLHTLTDFDETDTRELVAADYVYQIKRLAHPKVHSPILGLMGEYIVGLSDYAKALQQQSNNGHAIDLKLSDIEGVKILDRYRYQIKVNGRYPQLLYWLAMPFFAPIPWEADAFYQQAGLIKKNITLDWYPVGTGPYQLVENDPNRRMVLTKNPYFHGEKYPTVGEAEDQKSGLLVDAGKSLPFIDKVIYSLEKENIPYWNKFLQGYYDVSGISSDSFDQAIQVGTSGDFALSDAMKKKGIQLETAITTSIGYLGFNMLDPVIGGYTESATKLRQAISIAIDYEEYISIFANGRGIVAQGPIPPGIFGYNAGERGVNTTTHYWQQQAKRRSIEYAKQLLSEAGYPHGRHVDSGEPLVLHFDVPAGGPDDKANLDWVRKQFQKLGIQLVIRNTDYNRFQEKMRTGKAQIFRWGWNADYPDPENFLFLLYGNNGKVKFGGENAANYNNKEFNRLFEMMRVMDNTAERQVIIDEMVAIVREDAPWVWGFHPKQFSLYHAWNKNVKPNLMANNTLKYRRLEPSSRKALQAKWNKPLLWPISVIVAVIFLLILPAVIMYRKKNMQKLDFSS